MDLNSQLWDACLDGDVDSVKDFIARGASLSWIGQGDKTPLSIAAYCDKHEIVEVLLKHGANIDEVDQYNRSALHWAALFGHKATVVVLLEKGANVSLPTKVSGSTPLLVAVGTGKLDIVKLLVSKGASWNVANKNGLTPMALARMENHSEIVDYLSSLDNSEARLKKALSEDKKVRLKVTRMSIHGPPGSGKTCLQHLLLNESPPETRESTGVVTSAIRASASTLIHSDQTFSMTRVSEEEFVTRLAQGLNVAPSDDTSTTGGATGVSLEEPTKCKKVSRLKKMKNLFRHKCSHTSATPSSNTPDQSSTDKASPVSFSHSLHYDIISHLSSESGSDEIYQAHWVYCIDSGGQAAFQDIAPPFLRLNSLNIITLRLIDELDQYPNNEFALHGHIFRQERQQLTNRQMITNFARSLLSFSRPVHHSDHLAQPHLLVIGTYMDRKDECQETLQDKEKLLKGDLHIYKDICIKTPEGDHIHPVNTLVDDEHERQQVASHLSKIITSRKDCEIDVPFKWFCFQLQIVREAKERSSQVLSREECREIACSFEMESTMEDALSFFDGLGMLLYYPAALPDIVFTHPEPLLKKVSELVCLTFINRLTQVPDLHYSLPPSSHEELKDNGLFTMEVLTKLDNGFFNSLFSPHDFVELLLHLLIIAFLPQVSKYFLPCVLPCLPISEEEIFRYTKVDPIILSYGRDDLKPIPYGLFTGLVNGLNADKSLSLITKSDDFQQRRNFIGFRYCHGGWLVVADRTCYIEVFFTGQHHVCPEILQMVCNGLSQVQTLYGYKSGSLGEIKKGFYDSSCNHIHFIGSCNNGIIKINCRWKEYDMAPKQLPWFTDTSLQPSNTVQEDDWLQSVDNRPLDGYRGTDFFEVDEAVYPVTNWEDLGIALKLNPCDIQEIKKSNSRNVKSCRKEAVKKWMYTSECPSWRVLCTALCKETVGHPRLAKVIGQQHPQKIVSQATVPSEQNPVTSSETTCIPSALTVQSSPMPVSTNPEQTFQATPVAFSKPIQANSDNSAFSRTTDVYQEPITQDEQNDTPHCQMIV